VTTGRTAVEQVLDQYRTRTLAEIERHLPTGEPKRWLYEPLADYPRRLGKGMRATLCLASCDAFGGSGDEAITAAAAIELAHCAFLVHDDIQDGAEWRRGRPSLHRCEGTPLALNTGDALAVLSYELLRRGGARFGRSLSSRLMDEFTTAIWRTLEGQALELGWRRDGIIDVGLHDYLELVLAKTCWYSTILPLRLGALIGTRGAVDPSGLQRFGLLLGTAFQITDDVLNLTGAQDCYGKEIGSDLREGKRTLLLMHLLSVAPPPVRDEVADFLTGPEQLRTDVRVKWLSDQLVEHGSIAFAQDFGRGVADAAVAAFPEAFGSARRPEQAEVVRDLIAYVVERVR
jgi:geranylgeranyl diphosphate synthase type II